MSDLTTEEQTNVRTALRFLRLQSGGWKTLAKALHCDGKQLCKVGAGRGVTASLAFRVARLAGVPVDDVLAGRYPGEGTCPYCGHREEVIS
ncbi:MAG TPA: hypothetical protein VH877_26145 [Polyangia bacterium]|jgi:hypothetical protein|nr:hypothetical protein [Polyangia bacterium]